MSKLDNMVTHGLAALEAARDCGVDHYECTPRDVLDRPIGTFIAVANAEHAAELLEVLSGLAKKWSAEEPEDE